VNVSRVSLRCPQSQRSWSVSVVCCCASACKPTHLQTVAADANASAGQMALVPVHFSSRSQIPSDALCAATTHSTTAVVWCVTVSARCCCCCCLCLHVQLTCRLSEQKATHLPGSLHCSLCTSLPHHTPPQHPCTPHSSTKGHQDTSQYRQNRLGGHCACTFPCTVLAGNNLQQRGIPAAAAGQSASHPEHIKCTRRVCPVLLSESLISLYCCCLA
jgi:hypothetical protein